MTDYYERRPPQEWVDMYRRMLLIRHLEEKIYYLFLQGKLPGTVHQSQGQEAVAVGTCWNLRKDDYIVSTHRPHGHALAKGMSPKALMAELFAKQTGCCHGKGGSMHLTDVSNGILPAIAIVGAGIPIGAGVGLAFKYKKTDQVVAVFFGDGASNEGAFHEGINLAAIWNLPVLFVCENNLYGASTHVTKVMRVENIADRACAYGIPGVTVDGNNLLAVDAAVAEAVKRARAGEGPTLIECKTYRLVGHSRRDPGHYRKPDELEEWKKRDPIPRFKAELITRKALTEDQAQDLEQSVLDEIEEAVAYAEAQPSPMPEDALRY